jgi:hypothetical protein
MDEALLNPENTTSTEENVADSQSPEVEEPVSAPQEMEKPTEADSPDAEPETEPIDESVTLQFNHEDVKVSRDEAVRLAQHGYFVEKLNKEHNANLKEVISALDYVATIQGKTVNEIVEGLKNGIENAYREELVEELGAENPLVEEMLELRRSKNDKTYETAKAERLAREKQAAEEAEKSVSVKLAEQFEGVREMFPEFDAIEKVPDVVLKKAIKSGDLEKEMLRYKLTEQKKVETAKAVSEKNKKENIGPIASEVTEDGVYSAFLKGLWG